MKIEVDLKTAPYKLMLIVWQRYWKVGKGGDVFEMLNAEYDRRDAYNDKELHTLQTRLAAMVEKR